MTPPSIGPAQIAGIPLTPSGLVFREIEEADVIRVAAALAKDPDGAAAFARIQAGIAHAKSAYEVLATAYAQAEGERDDWRRQAIASQAHADGMYDLLHPKKS
jgi:anti-sigma factor RsiW